MRFFSITFILVFLAFTPKAISYPQDQFNACVLSAKANPDVAGTPDSAIEGFCDCALKEILDKGKEESKSAKQCAKKNFNK